MAFPPLMFAVLVVLAICAAGIIASMVREARLFGGFREIAVEVKAVAKQIAGDIFRDGHDLVVAGHYEDVPTMVRFSNHENTPAITLDTRIASVSQFTFT